MGAAYRERITLSPINSGATKPFPAPRGRGTFLPTAGYPSAYWRRPRKAGERVVELAVTGGMPDAERLVRRVLTMRGEEVVAIQYIR